MKASYVALLAAALFASAASAAPVATEGRARFNLVPTVPATFVGRQDGRPISRAPIASFGPTNPLQAALDYVQERFAALGTSNAEYIIKDNYKTAHNGVTHVYLRQVINGLEVINGDINVNVAKDGSIISMGDSFFQGADVPQAAAVADAEGYFSVQATKEPITAQQALRAFSRYIGKDSAASFFAAAATEEVVDLGDNEVMIRNVPFAESDVKARMVYVQTEEGLKLGWELTLQTEDNWFNSVVCAISGNVLAVHDWVSDYAAPRTETYNVFPLGVEDPSDGDRKVLVNPYSTTASPLGWKDNGKTQFTNSIGNNVDSYGPKTARAEGGAGLKYDFKFDPTVDPNQYIDFSITEMDYLSNMFHDITYLLGFDEVSGNFQTSNFGKGGKENDAVKASTQDASGTNNANFATPPDGQAGQMRMFVFTQTKPKRDGSLQSSIVIHELSHGLSTRLTGGPANSNCLQSGEPGGMGEGWGDIISTITRQRPEFTREQLFPQGAYVLNNKAGVRRFPYTTDMKANPETYSYVKKSSEVHNLGDVWASIVLEVYWNLREARGFDEDLLTLVNTADGRKKFKGRGIFLLNLIDGMKLQPCRPTFIQARDAIIQADKQNFNGENVCLIWKGFAKRGLGIDAKAGGVDGFAVPAECQ